MAQVIIYSFEITPNFTPILLSLRSRGDVRRSTQQGESAEGTLIIKAQLYNNKGLCSRPALMGSSTTICTRAYEHINAQCKQTVNSSLRNGATTIQNSLYVHRK